MNLFARPLPLLLFLLLQGVLACNSAPKKTASGPSDAAPEWALLPFRKADAANPVLQPDTSQVFFCPVRQQTVRWEEKDVFNPAAVVRNDTVFLLYRAEDKVGRFAGTSRIGLAWSTDGLRFTREKEPVLYPDNDEQKRWEWEGGCEDPRVVQDEGGTYYMTYSAYDGDKARLLVASSRDLRHWQKHGPAFAQAYGGKYGNTWSKSGSIVSEYRNGSPVAVKINGKYWMYWGDVNIWAATSDDLVHWSPVLYGEGEKAPIPLRHNAKEIPEIKIVLGPRAGMFDSDLVEPGPPALLTGQGIVLIYNSRNVPKEGDPALAEGTYTVSQVLIDPKDPTRVLDRMDHYFLRPDQPYEINGQVNHVCFAEALVRHRDRWFLYYGTADSKIAAALKE